MQRDGTSAVVRITVIQTQIRELNRAEEQRVIARHLTATLCGVNAIDATIAPPADMRHWTATGRTANQGRAIQLHHLRDVPVAIDIGGNGRFHCRHQIKNMQSGLGTSNECKSKAKQLVKWPTPKQAGESITTRGGGG